MFRATKFRSEICAFILAVVLGSALLPFAAYSSTCTGSDPCNACKIANTASIARRMGENAEFVGKELTFNMPSTDFCKETRS